MRRALGFGVAVLLIVGLTAVTSRAMGDAWTYGVGVESCGSWTNARRGNDWFTRGQWILGFVSASSYHGRRLVHTDSQAMASWMDQYCASHPLDNLFTASAALVDELEKRPER